MSKLGLVFSGGGGKGAYEVGVWKALREFGIDQGVQAIAGTSVGGLNGALFIRGDYAVAERLWKSISPDKILKIDATSLAKKMTAFASRYAMPTTLFHNMAAYLQGRGWFTQEGLLELMREAGVSAAVAQSERPFYVCALNGSTFQLELPNIAGRPEDEVEKWLLASAAIPVVFGSVKIQGQRYHDGGVVPGLNNNIPYQPLIEKEGCSHIISVFLDNAPLLHQEQQRYPATKFWNIVPKKEFSGGLLATLDFTADNAHDLMERGYSDAKELLIRFGEFQRSEEESLRQTAKIQASWKLSQKQVETNQDIRNEDDALADNPLQRLDALRAEIDRRELDLIDAGLEDFLERNAQNSQLMQETLFEGIATLASTEGRIKQAMNRGHWSRLWGAITGKSGKLTAEVQWDLNRAIYCNQQLIAKLSERNALTLEAVASLGSRLNYVMAHINYQTTAGNFHYRAIKTLAACLDQLQRDLHGRFRGIENRLDKVEYRTDLQMWLLSLPREFSTLSTAQAVLCTTAKFYEKTSGDWHPDEYGALVGQVSTAGMDSKCSLRALAEAATQFPALPDADRFSPPLGDALMVHPAFGSVHPATSNALACLEERGISCTVEVPAVQLVSELLCSMRLRDRRSDEVVAAYVSRVEALVSLCHEVNLKEYQKPLQRTVEAMREYRILAPLIGKFSAGKSTLLNAVLGQELLGVDIDPETADASELHYGAPEQAEGICLDGQRQACAHVTANLPSSASNPIWYYRRHINNPALQALDKLVLVDMPGLESNKFDHEKAIANYMERGEVFLGVVSSDAAFDESVMRVLREAHGNAKELHLIVTKCGRHSETKLAEIQQSLQEFFAGLEPRPEIVLVESRDGAPGIDALTSLLCRLSSRFKEFFQRRFEAVLSDLETQIRTKLERELALASCDDVEIKQQMAAEQKVFAQLAETARREQQTLQKYLCGDGMEQVAGAVLQTLSASEDVLVEAAMSRTLQQVVATMVRPVVQSEARRVADSAVREYTINMEKSLRQPGFEMEIPIAVMIPDIKEDKSGMFGAGLGALLGVLIAGGPLGALLGGLLGLFGRKNDGAREERRALIHSQVIPQVLLSVRQQLQPKFAEYAAEVAGSSQAFIEEQRQALEERRTRMLEDLQQRREEHEARRQQLRQAIAQVGVAVS